MPEYAPLTKPVLRVLEKCFEDEMHGKMLTQFGRGRHCIINGIPVSDAVARAHSEGLIEQVDHRPGGWPPVLVRGFALTHKGRMEYCDWASAHHDPADDDRAASGG